MFKNKFILIALLGVVFITGVAWYLDDTEQTQARTVVDNCDESLIHSEYINCLYNELWSSYAENGIEGSFETFNEIYRNSERFSDSGCHRHAHRMGDIAYYYDYLSHRSVENMLFPKSANVCGYGFYHGFVEHYIQDHPTPEKANELCEYLISEIESYAPAITQVCYHGAGHGFLLAQSDTLMSPDTWNIHDFTQDPIKKCRQLVGISQQQLNECEEGVFNVFVDWAIEGGYGFEIDREQPFLLCDELEHTEREFCYIEISRKVEAMADFDIVRAAEILDATDVDGIKEIMFSIVIGGLIQRNPTEVPIAIYNDCKNVAAERFRNICTYSIAAGLYEHGIPSEQHKVASEFCAYEGLSDSERESCLKALEGKVSRFDIDQM